MPPGSQAGFFDQFIDREDGWLDASEFLLRNAAGFLPVPIVITEPAIGEGAGLAAVFFHPPEDFNPDAALQDGEFVMPNISAAAGAITNNDSWFAGGGHLHHWRDDRIRYEGFAGYASLKLTYFAQVPIIEEEPGFRFDSEGAFLHNEIKFRIRDSSWFVGAGQTLIDLENTFRIPVIPGVEPASLDASVSSLQFLIEYEDVDSTFTPGDGIEAELALERYDDAIGSDFNLWTYKVSSRFYRPLGSHLNISIRLDGRFVDGDVPFFLLPYIDMRGIPALRYQSDSVVVAETELRWSFHRRVSLVGFVGAGRAADSLSELGDARSRVAKGVGIRYFLMRMFGAHVGIDIADGPEDTVWYLTIGNAW